MEPSDGLFTVKCECGIEFPAEAGECSCGKKKGELKLDIDQFLNRVYETQEKKLDEAMDLVFEVFWQLYDKFDIMNDILARADVSKLNSTMMVGFLSQTFRYDMHVPNHVNFCQRVEDRLRELGEPETRVSSLLKGLRGSGKYWEDMKVLGAPGWLTGPKP